MNYHSIQNQITVSLMTYISNFLKPGISFTKAWSLGYQILLASSACCTTGVHEFHFLWNTVFSTDFKVLQLNALPGVYAS
eukprot:COSAG01_NODE_1326_length_10718_cov_11.125718_8_plen_80_part_00